MTGFPTMNEKAKATQFIDNSITRVTEWRFPPGAATGWHRHEHDYVVVPMTSGKLKLVSHEAEQVVELTSGVPYFKKKGVEHDVININEYEFVFIETEFY